MGQPSPAVVSKHIPLKRYDVGCLFRWKNCCCVAVSFQVCLDFCSRSRGHYSRFGLELGSALAGVFCFIRMAMHHAVWIHVGMLFPACSVCDGG